MDLSAIDRKEATKFGMQLWIVTGHKDVNKGCFGTNLRVGVAAHTLEEALAAAAKLHPNARWIGISHQGPIELVVNS